MRTAEEFLKDFMSKLNTMQYDETDKEEDVEITDEFVNTHVDRFSNFLKSDIYKKIADEVI